MKLGEFIVLAGLVAGGYMIYKKYKEKSGHVGSTTPMSIQTQTLPATQGQTNQSDSVSVDPTKGAPAPSPGVICPPVLNPQVQQTAAFLERQLQSNQELIEACHRRIAMLEAMPTCPAGCGSPSECTKLVPGCVTEAERANAIAKERQMIEYWTKLSTTSAQTLNALRACGVR